MPHFQSFFLNPLPALPLSKAKTSSNSKPSLHSSIPQLQTATTTGPTACRLPTLLFNLLILVSTLLCSSVFLLTGLESSDCDYHWSNYLPTADVILQSSNTGIGTALFFRLPSDKMSSTPGNVRGIPTESSKASTVDDIEITNYNEVVELNIEENLEDQADHSKANNNNFRCIERNAKKFECVLNQCKLKNKKKVALDVQTRWNSTYLMLESTLPLKEAFNRLAQIDRNYKFCPTEDEWRVANVVHRCLKIFYDCTNHFGG
ncbi:hypothetical protein M9H77_14289 [Catharanthus roseus]|uniref:Uncharacterized protein n=1 Tax=Catharanthus roseus TaxID=4058 RepID=A0ACC0BMM6_CATRO|nr:hypothetical protein M9H77_14289 [Catharanthus roseus]